MSVSRRLPVYILADCSGSMEGSPIVSVNQGIAMLHENLKSTPQAIENAFLSVITFDSGARQVIPLTEVLKFQPPNLEASGLTAMGEALGILIERLNNEVQKSTADTKADWRPLVFIFTDGTPSDDISAHAKTLRGANAANIIAIACGDEAEPAVLKEITDTVLVMRDTGPDAFKKFFKWVSDVVKTASVKVEKAGAGPATGMQVPPPPADTFVLDF